MALAHSKRLKNLPLPKSNSVTTPLKNFYSWSLTGWHFKQIPEFNFNSPNNPSWNGKKLPGSLKSWTIPWLFQSAIFRWAKAILLKIDTLWHAHVQRKLYIYHINLPHQHPYQDFSLGYFLVDMQYNYDDGYWPK